ncbi:MULTISPECIES: extracellular solute-binding protein [unclassified Streptomyces]|uniref:ABC transporter substrate-binding protein n=1 Tax=unclassified Streptomyces TaxID=2593676 RepID=UPI0034156D01
MRTTRPLLRAALAGCLLAVAALVSAGCSTEKDRTLVVLGPWTDGEEQPFVDTLKKISERTGDIYVYEGTRSLRETLVAQLRTDTPPDVAILNGQGELAEYARDGDALPLPEGVAEAAIGPWSPRITLRDKDGEQRQHSYWVPVRVDLKSIVWSRPDDRDAAGNPTWCLGMASGATSGWPGTDWIEDLLLQRYGPSVYERWATGDLEWDDGPVREAWRSWRTLLTAGGGNAGKNALATSFQGRNGLLNSGDCTLEHQGSFIRRHYGNDVLPAPTSDVVPGLPGPQKAYEVSGDMAAVFTPSDAAWKLMRQLTSRETRDDWAAAAKPAERPIFPDRTAGPGALTAGTAKVLELFREADELCFDASDAMPSTLRGAFQRAVLEFLQNPRDDKLLDGLLRQLEAERRLQREAGAFAIDHLCGGLPDG